MIYYSFISPEHKAGNIVYLGESLTSASLKELLLYVLDDQYLNYCITHSWKLCKFKKINSNFKIIEEIPEDIWKPIYKRMKILK